MDRSFEKRRRWEMPREAEAIQMERQRLEEEKNSEKKRLEEARQLEWSSLWDKREMESEAMMKQLRLEIMGTQSESTKTLEEYTVYVVMNCSNSNHLGAVYQVKIQQGGLVKDGVELKDDGTPIPLIGDPVCDEFLELNGEVPKNCLLECARFRSLLLGTDAVPPDDPTKFSKTSHGFILNLNTTEQPSCVPFRPPAAAKPDGIVMSAYKKLYFLAHPRCFPNIPDPSFERYDPVVDEWEPLPSYEYSGDLVTMIFDGYAVCQNCILVSAFSGCHARCEYKVFNVNNKKWYQVDNSPGYAFRGRAEVVGNTIYALPQSKGDVMAFSLTRCWDAAGEIVSYSFSAISLLKGMEVKSPPYGFCGPAKTYMVHLGNLVFCHLKTNFNSFSGWGPEGGVRRHGRQYMCITTFWICNGMIRTLHSTVRGVPIWNSRKLKIKFCFTPDCKDFDLEEEEEKRLL